MENPKEILENIPISSGEPMPDMFSVLKADFKVNINDRIDYYKLNKYSKIEGYTGIRGENPEY